MASRYGARIRKQEEAVLKAQRATYECPRCGKQRVKRAGFARWKCRACGAEFAGGAYSPSTTVGKVARKILSGEGCLFLMGLFPLDLFPQVVLQKRSLKADDHLVFRWLIFYCLKRL